MHQTLRDAMGYRIVEIGTKGRGKGSFRISVIWYAFSLTSHVLWKMKTQYCQEDIPRFVLRQMKPIVEPSLRWRTLVLDER